MSNIELWQMLAGPNSWPVDRAYMKKKQDVEMWGLMTQPAKFKLGDVVQVNDSRKPYKGTICQITYTARGYWGRLMYGIDGDSMWRHYEPEDVLSLYRWKLYQ